MSYPVPIAACRVWPMFLMAPRRRCAPIHAVCRYVNRRLIPHFLEQGWRVLAFDQVGFGRSDKPARRQLSRRKPSSSLPKSSPVSLLIPSTAVPGTHLLERASGVWGCER